MNASDLPDASLPDGRTVQSTRVEFSGHDGRMIPALLWRPVEDGAFPGIVFITDIFGLKSEMERLGKTIASWGYVVLAPDLFAGGWLKCIVGVMKDLKSGEGRSTETLLRGRAFLAEQPFVKADTLGVLGFCLGGGFALLLAKDELFRVAAAFYGETPKDMSRACPVVASYGALDDVMTPTAAKLKDALERQGVELDSKIYPGAGHGFMTVAPNPVVRFLSKRSPLHSAYNEPAAKDATLRTYRFLARHLNG
jgi:carboxymethylenebutenolidase